MKTESNKADEGKAQPECDFPPILYPSIYLFYSFYLLSSFLPTYLGSDPKSVDRLSEVLSTQMLFPNLKEARETLAVLNMVMPSQL